jgi:hypothetical protein
MYNEEALQLGMERPIPGQSLTKNPDEKYPWEGPPKVTALKDATEKIFLNLISDESLPQIVEALSSGIPVGDLTQIILRDGFQKGEFNPDLMTMLVEPIMYMLLSIGEKAGIQNMKLYRGEELDEEPDAEENMALANEAKTMQEISRNPKSFADIKPKEIRKGIISPELEEQLQTKDIGSLLSRREKEIEEIPSLLDRGDQDGR